LGYERIYFRVGDGTLGLPEEAPFDRIVVTAMAPAVPDALFRQLREGGRMVMPVGTPEQQQLQLVIKSSGKPIVQDLCGCLFVKLIGAQGWPEEDERGPRQFSSP
jgi:protein-L-isoaspartate(D-aspartate) O-methyltransferase